MSNIVQVVRDDLDSHNASPKKIEKAPMYVRRAIISLNKDGGLPPRILEYQVKNVKEEKRDGNGNLIYNFIFLPDDFLKLDKFTVYNVDKEDNRTESVYQQVSTDFFFSKRDSEDSRKFFSLVDYNIDNERSRKILVLDPFPEDDEYIEIRYFMDGTETSLENLNSRFWEPIISKVHHLAGLKNFQEAEREINKESANWRNQEGKDSFNQTHNTTDVKFPWGKTR